MATIAASAAAWQEVSKLGRATKSSKEKERGRNNQVPKKKSPQTCRVKNKKPPGRRTRQIAKQSKGRTIKQRVHQTIAIVAALPFFICGCFAQVLFTVTMLSLTNPAITFNAELVKMGIGLASLATFATLANYFNITHKQLRQVNILMACLLAFHYGFSSQTIPHA